jgi:hypothetical protein
VSIDRGDSHIEHAGTWEKACRHISLYLWWAAERGMASELHPVKAIAKNPTRHFIQQCDTKLWEDDLTADGNRFAELAYGDYCTEVSRYAASLGVGDYEIPENATTKDHFFAWLDARYEKYRTKAGNLVGVAPKRAKKVQAKPKVKAKPKRSKR